ncbi:hypothetical protein EDC96DRAFT_548053 [Choanephora cucurbitarum]|nr:hypothetical protein EDC96DRAFT_548053 [Choanephora cucurbitarum]
MQNCTTMEAPGTSIKQTAAKNDTVPDSVLESLMSKIQSLLSFTEDIKKKQSEGHQVESEPVESKPAKTRQTRTKQSKSKQDVSKPVEPPVRRGAGQRRKAFKTDKKEILLNLHIPLMSIMCLHAILFVDKRFNLSMQADSK